MAITIKCLSRYNFITIWLRNEHLPIFYFYWFAIIFSPPPLSLAKYIGNFHNRRAAAAAVRWWYSNAKYGSFTIGARWFAPRDMFPELGMEFDSPLPVLLNQMADIKPLLRSLHDNGSITFGWGSLFGRQICNLIQIKFIIIDIDWFSEWWWISMVSNQLN